MLMRVLFKPHHIQFQLSRLPDEASFAEFVLIGK